MLQMMSDLTNKVGEITNKVGEITGKVGEMTKTVNSHAQLISKLEAQITQMDKTLNRMEEGKLPSQLVVNPKGLYIEEGSTSHLKQVQAIITLRSEMVDKNVEEKKDERN